ncbi:MAG: Hsp20/alpha crystallin family protein [Candidatus Kapaibacterium sp.]
MKLVHMHPMNGFDTMVRRMNHLLQDLDVGGRRLESAATTPARSWTPRVDITENATTFSIRMDLPGVPKEHVTVSVDERRVLTVHGEFAKEELQDGITVHRKERRSGSFDRSFTLPDTIDADGITAQFEHGVLHLSLSKKDEQKPGVKTITVG